jgi:imidazolonepropionase-like amidohydrolase
MIVRNRGARMRMAGRCFCALMLSLAGAGPHTRARAAEPTGYAEIPPTAAPITAFVGGTVIDGNGGAPISDATVLVSRGKIVRVGPSSSVKVPHGARTISVAGKYLIPGLIDVNVHLTSYSAPNDDSAQLEKDIVRAAQGFLARGVTTVRDSYGFLGPLLAAKASLRTARNGARLLVAGNILGWGDLTSYSMLGQYAGKVGGTTAPADSSGAGAVSSKLDLVQGMGENLIGMDATSLRPLLGAYIDKGVDFVKIGVTTHVAMPPVFLLFSPRALETMVRVAHQRGRKVDAHAVSSEGLRMAALAGVDVVQHPEILAGYPMSDSLAALLTRRGVICAIVAANYTGPNWESRRAGAATQRRERDNAKKLIEHGCTVAVASDDYPSNIDHWTKDPFAALDLKLEGDSLLAARRAHEWGKATIASIEGLVELGMTPSSAITAATKHGAMAAGALKSYGTITEGKRADIVVLDANPLQDIHNITKVSIIVRDGRVMQRAR